MTDLVLGVQWGDEGKGKVIDRLASKYDYVVRYQGGHNAGHTLVVEGKKYALHVLPSGVLYPGCINVIANGVVVSPEALLKDMQQFQDLIPLDRRLLISDRAHLITPYHEILDSIQESSSLHPVGTTRKGIGPCYKDKIARIGLRMGDLRDMEYVEKKLHNYYEGIAYLQDVYEIKLPSPKEVLQTIKNLLPKILPLITDTTQILLQNLGRKHILLEGAQGSLLDVDHGTYPYVTSSNTTSGGSITGSGIPPNKIQKILGVSKAYCTRVGEGPFPTQEDGEYGKRLASVGREFGTTTGRMRRCGWLDALALKYACAINGCTHLALMKLDVLDGFSEVKICTHYLKDSKKISHFPFNLDNVQPVYQTLKGWEGTAKVRCFSDLPENAKIYIRTLQNLLGVKISLISTSPDRLDTILLEENENV